MKGRNAQKPPLSKGELELFYSHVCEGSKSNAKWVLLNSGDGKDQSDWTEGYLTALKGMVHSLSDKDSFLSHLTNSGFSRSHLQEVKREFKSRAQSHLLEPYDQGFFSAWMNLAQTLSKRPRE
ncbi:hypothetical protein ISS96_02960 [Candidatus Bathyarchaeota archaeon]|nr:hypothetical protein [Candidatus Bathyarchaeota archaeon]